MASRRKRDRQDDSGASASPAPRPPVDIELSVNVRLGKEGDAPVWIMRNRRLRIAGSVLHYRDRILRGFAGLLVELAMLPPRRVGRRIQPRKSR